MGRAWVGGVGNLDSGAGWRDTKLWVQTLAPASTNHDNSGQLVGLLVAWSPICILGANNYHLLGLFGVLEEGWGHGKPSV